MSDTRNKMRMDRIERLLHELRYEIERGMMEREIDEWISFRFVVPVSRHFPNGVVECRFESRPVPDYMSRYEEPRLKIVGKHGD